LHLDKTTFLKLDRASKENFKRSWARRKVCDEPYCMVKFASKRYEIRQKETKNSMAYFQLPKSLSTRLKIGFRQRINQRNKLDQ